MMTKTMALELAKDNIRANIVAPGAIETDMNRELRDNKVDLKFSDKYLWEELQTQMM
jgi:NAD(P)-dependent dehydrogenase (short-subunit alcohol dehydrogenase family)